ncbi:hypothetical protein C8J57DRAFT_1471436 [Mycena rebaudengoi]|nr:hypothetical protein C8J57DRAFT_1471436 [Mycena rebaudengoi]
MIFFQDEAEFLCSRRAVNGVWQPAVRLWKAERETPIAATMLSDSKIMHVFFQVGNNIVVYLGSFDGNWVQGFFDIPVPKTFSSMAAVSWPAGSWPGPQIRLYMQAQDGSIMEISRGPHDSGRYTGLITVGLGLPNVDISVFWRWGPSLGSSIYLYYLNDAKILQQAVGKTKLPDWPPPDAKAIVSWVPRSTTLDLTHLSAVETGSNGGTGRIHINLAGTDLANDSNSTAPTTQYNPSPQHRPMAIAGTRWPAGIRVYAQTGDGVIREGCLDESTQWDQAAQAVVLIESWQRGLCSNGLIEFKIFIKEKIGDKIQRLRRGWTVSGFTQAGAMPGTAISAVHNTNAHDMLLFFQDSSGFLCYRLAVNLVWEDSVCLCKAATGTPITATTWNNAMDIRLYFQDTSNQLRELYTTLDDGWHGTCIYAQQDDNSVTQLSCSGDFLYLAMPLNTGSNGILENTAISAFGVPTASDMNAHLYWANVDKILQQRVISHNLWSPATVVGDLASCEPLGDHTGVVTPLDQLVAQAKVVSDSITAIVQENAALAASVTTLSGSLTSELHVPAEEAVAGMKVLALSVEALSKASGSDSAPLVKRCKGQSVTVAHRFDVLYTKAHAMLGDGTNLATDITYQESVVQLKITRVEAIRKQAQVLQQGDEKLIKEYETEIQSLQSQIGFIEQAKQHARAAMTETEGIRIVRDIFTLGLGEIGDWGGLNEAIHYADTQIGMCNTEIADTQADIATAQSAIDGIKVELGHFADLKTQLDGFDPILQAQTTILLPMATHITEIENKALDLATALSKLAAEGDVLFVQHKARQLAGSVVAIEQWMGTSSQLSGVFIDNPESMDATLEAIAKSPVKHDAADEML